MPSIEEPRLLGAEPQIFVEDFGAASAFYVGKLGFNMVFAYGEPPFYAQIAKGDARLNLRRVDGPVFAAGARDRNDDLLAAIVTVEGIEELLLVYKGADVPLHQELRREPWGAHSFIVRDPDDNLIGFAGD